MPEQISKSFKVSGFFDANDDLLKDMPDLTNENLFDKEKFRFSRKGGYYEAIMPALRLAHTLQPDALRAIHHEIRDFSGKKTPSNTLLSLIRPIIPFIDMYDGIYD